MQYLLTKSASRLRPDSPAMPRTPRVEYENAVCHAMARGNRREPIVHDDGDRQLFVVIDYVHLNPGRAGTVEGVAPGLLDYPWSSIAAGYGHPPSKRPGWMAVAEGLDLLGESGTTAGRRRWIAEKLNLKSTANVSQQIRRFEREAPTSLPKEVKAWRLSRNVA